MRGTLPLALIPVEYAPARHRRAITFGPNSPIYTNARAVRSQVSLDRQPEV